MTTRPPLAARRKAQGLSQEALAQFLEVHTQTVYKWETGEQVPSVSHRAGLAQALNVSLSELPALLGHELPGLSGHTVSPWLSHYASLEQGAARMERFDPLTIPGLLQTPRYAEAVLRGHYLTVTDEQVDQRVGARVARATVLQRKPEPLELHCIIDEAVLSRPAGEADVMREQLQHLVTVCQQPNVTLQVVEAGSGLLHCASAGSFDLFTAEAGASPFMACTETVSSFNYLDGHSSIQEYTQLFSHLAQAALSPGNSADLITQTNMENKQCRKI